MKYFLVFYFIHLWSFGLCFNVPNKGLIGTLASGANTAVSSVASVANSAKDLPVIRKVIPSYCITPPKECPNKNITFWYYTRSNPDTPVQLDVANPNTFNNLEKNQNPWKVIIHGYTKSKNEIPNPELRSAYFKHGDYNLISVDYEPLARDKCYTQAVSNTPLIANCTAQMIDALIDRHFFRADDLHVIGFSLGGQIAGNIYKHMKNGKPNRVTGLDPAAPLFDGIIYEKLNPESGKFVDVIHTNGFLKGKVETSGHVDFYPNGGLNQPGCASSDNETASTCSHERSPLFYAESINSEKSFWGIPCKSYVKFFGGLCNTDESKLVIMGEYTPHTARGSYYLQTEDKGPFALGKLTKVG